MVNRKGAMENMVDLENLRQAYNGKKVFLTGHTGFKGSWLLAWLTELGAVVKGYSLSPENENDLYNLINGDSLCESVIGDIRNKELLESEILEFEPDFIFHFAAQALVLPSYELPCETFDINAMGTAHLLNAVKVLDKKCSVLCITTDKVYENKEWLYPYRESDRLGGYDPYSASKACAELIISSFNNSFFNSTTYSEHQKTISSARAGNVIGGGDFAVNRLMPDIVRAIQANETISLRNPKAIRPWQHVLEPLRAYLILAARMYESHTYADTWNIGPSIDENVSVEDMVKIAINHTGKGKIEYQDNAQKKHEAGLLKLDSSKANNLLGWFPYMNAEEAIKMTLDWYTNQDKGMSAYELVKNDISKYCAEEGH